MYINTNKLSFETHQRLSKFLAGGGYAASVVTTTTDTLCEPATAAGLDLGVSVESAEIWGQGLQFPTVLD